MIESDTFVDEDEDKLYLLVTLKNGSLLPDWISFEDVSSIISGFANENSTDLQLMIVADDHRGGSVHQVFNVTILELAKKEFSYWALILVCSMLLAFILIVCAVMCFKNVRCCKKKKKGTNDYDSDSDSFEEDDDICIEDPKPKNPF